MEPQNPSLTLLGAAVALIGVGEIAGVDDRVNRIFRVVTVFGFLGTAAAYRRSQRRPGVDPFPIITRWSFAGFGVGVAIEAVTVLLLGA